MLGRIRAHLTYANVMVTLLAFVIFGGGTAVATPLGVRSNDIVDGQVKAADLADRAVTSTKLKPPQRWREVAPGPTTAIACDDSNTVGVCS